MAKPLIPAEAIYARALELLDAEGLGALSAQRLVRDLRISTKTLYQQVGNRDQLTRALVARHFSRLRLEFEEYDTWEDTALHWCLALHRALRAHPHLTRLMTIEDRLAVTGYVNELVKAALRAGFPKPLAIMGCRSLATLTINHSVVAVQESLDPGRTADAQAEMALIEQNFPTLVRWTLAGMRGDLPG
ncbi:hypothetical protein [Nocardia sp. NPDC024068]|uniref:TetR/AcrR family transcriptional regulator n=1 Tax=Nocardia sp. NPDC024068 TaxID=3157197 RepID=UPI0033EB6639